MKLDIDFKHLSKVKSDYFKHLYYATKFNFVALLIFVTGTIHSIFPFVFAYTPYRLAKYIVEETEKNLGKPKDISK